MKNKGLDKKEVQNLRQKMSVLGQNYVVIDSDDNSEEYINFNFIGKYEGKDAIYDAVIYTLRLQHSSELCEIAEHKAAQRFPKFKQIKYLEDENGDLAVLDDVEEEIGLYMAEVMMELEEEEAVKVQEHIEMDINLNYGIGLDIGLNNVEITPGVISQFIDDFNNDNLSLNPNLFSFQHEEEPGG
jgi:hypothetical protein